MRLDRIEEEFGAQVAIEWKSFLLRPYPEPKPMDAFRASVQTWPDVVECSSLTGEMDYLLRVLVSDMAHYSRFVMDTLLKHPSVQDCKTSFVLDRVKHTTAVPLPESRSR